MSSSEDAPLLIGGVLLKDRWEILRKIGRGGFGEIYKAKDHETGERCAVKVESAVSSKQVLKMEVLVLKRLQSCSPHICTLLGCGRTDRINYMVMNLLGPNLSELRKQQPKQKFSISTTLRVGVQVIAALRAMHNCGFLHRDIKPSNFAIGASSITKHTCFMLDFGLARQFMSSSGEIRPPRQVAGFRGTVRYASINAHQSKDLGRHDDLWSVFYLLVELAHGELPWKKIRDKEKAGKFKMSYNHKRLLKHLPTEFYDFLDHLKSLDYFQEPNYIMLSTLLQNAIRYLGIKRSDPFDWEQDGSVQSLTTISAGSAPVLQSNNKATKEKKEVNNVDGYKTNLSTEECMTQEVARKESDNAKKEFFSNDENGRIETTSSVVQPKPVNQLQQRHSMPPSPLLQATHLIHNDSGTAHADSLDRFFEMKAGDDARSRSNSCKTSSRSQRPSEIKKKSPKFNDKVTPAISNSPEQKHHSRKILKKENTSRKSENSKSKSLTLSLRSHEIDGDVKQENVEEFENANKLEKAKSPTQSPHNSHKQDKDTEFAAASTMIHPEVAPSPKFAYTADNPSTVNSDHIVPATKPAIIKQQPKHPNVVLADTQKTEEHILHGRITTDRKRVDDRENYVSLKLHKLDENGRTVVEVTTDVCIGNGEKCDDRNSLVGAVDEHNSQRQEESTPSDNSGLQHRLFACKIQSGSEQVNHTELLPLKTISTSRGDDRYSPGPPPLEFNKGRPQRMWGHDSTQPISLTHAPTNQTTCSSETEPSLISPKPPDCPPPKHYTLLAARRKRFRRPAKS